MFIRIAFLVKLLFIIRTLNGGKYVRRFEHVNDIIVRGHKIKAQMKAIDK